MRRDRGPLDHSTETRTIALWERSASDLADMIARGDVTACEVVEAHIARIERVNAHINAVVVRRYDHARQEAADIDKRRAQGKELGRLAGVPISIKESIDVVGLPSTAGLRSMASNIARQNDIHVARLQAEDAIVLVKTNVAQLLLYMESDNPLYGRTNNPWDVTRAPGGSSGGETALLAAGGTAMGLGTDIGGSIRCPASFCGVAGIKPTTGRCDDPCRLSISTGQRAIISQVGPFARDTTDLALGLDIIAGGTPFDFPSVPPLGDHRRVQVEGLRVGYCFDDGVFSVSPAVRRAVKEAACDLASLGATVTEWQIPRPEEAIQVFYGLLAADGTRLLRETSKGNKLDPRVKALMMLGRLPRPMNQIIGSLLATIGQRQLAKALSCFGRVGADEYWRFTERQTAYRRSFLAALDQTPIGALDAIVLPSFAVPAMTHGASREIGLGGGYMLLANLLGFPAGSLPYTIVRVGEETDRAESFDIVENTARAVETASGGLPIGVQILARPWREDVVLAVMQALEKRGATRSDHPNSAAKQPLRSYLN